MQPETLKALVQSWRPFSRRLTDGTSLPVHHPEFIWITQEGKTAIVNPEGSQIRILDIELVTALETGDLAGRGI